MSQTVTLLRAAGWGLWGGRLTYAHHLEADEVYGVEQQAYEPELPNVLRLLDEKSKAGEVIKIDLAWQVGELVITCMFSSAKEVLIFPSVDTPRLRGSRHLTDWNWLLTRTLVPLMEAGYDPESVECKDSH